MLCIISRPIFALFDHILTLRSVSLASSPRWRQARIAEDKYVQIASMADLAAAEVGSYLPGIHLIFFFPAECVLVA